MSSPPYISSERGQEAEPTGATQGYRVIKVDGQVVQLINA